MPDREKQIAELDRKAEEAEKKACSCIEKFAFNPGDGALRKEIVRLIQELETNKRQHFQIYKAGLEDMIRTAEARINEDLAKIKKLRKQIRRIR